MKEKKDRVEDALNATRAAVEEGGGVAYIRAVTVLEKAQFPGEEQLGVKLIKRALEEPARQIAANAGFESSVVLQHIMEGAGRYVLEDMY